MKKMVILLFTFFAIAISSQLVFACDNHDGVLQDGAVIIDTAYDYEYGDYIFEASEESESRCWIYNAINLKLGFQAPANVSVSMDQFIYLKHDGRWYEGWVSTNKLSYNIIDKAWIGYFSGLLRSFCE